jgi:hypothetical protein
LIGGKGWAMVAWREDCSVFAGIIVRLVLPLVLTFLDTSFCYASRHKYMYRYIAKGMYLEKPKQYETEEYVSAGSARD